MMKPVNLSIILVFTLGTLALTPVQADSNQGKKEQRYEQRQDSAKSGRKAKQQKQYSRQQQKSARVNNKNLHQGQRKQDLKGQNKQLDKQHNRQDRHYGTYRKNNRYDRPSRYQRNYSKDRYADRRHHYTRHYPDNHRYEMRRGNRLLVLTPRHRTFRNVYIVRPFGHSYFGYGHFFNDHNAWRWLTFTTISLKLLDMVDEQAQREHETAQIEATTAEVGERIYWDTDEASGYVVTTREGTSSRGLTCREYQHTITVGGNTEDAYGTACLQPDGAWKIVN